MLKLAGRIKVEEYSAQMWEIIEKVKKELANPLLDKLGAGEDLKIGKVWIPYGKGEWLELRLMNDKGWNGKGGLSAGALPFMVFNKAYLSRDTDSELKTVVKHELSHFLDNRYTPTRGRLVGDMLDRGDFLKDFRVAFGEMPTNVDWGNIESFRGQSIEKIARNKVLRFLKSAAFKELAGKYSLIVNEELVGKMMREVRGMMLEEMAFYRDTGGQIFDIPQNEKETAQLQDVGIKTYFRSDEEMKAYMNSVVEEIDQFLREKDKERLLLGFITGDKSISKELPELLERSPSFRLLEEHILPVHLRKFYHEVGRYLLEKYSKKSVGDWAAKAGVKLDSRGELMFRYLMKLWDAGRLDKVKELLQQPKFIEENNDALLAFKARVNFSSSVAKIREQMAGL